MNGCVFVCVLDHTEPAFVTHIRNPCHFVVQLNRSIDRLTELSHAINHYCKTVASKNDIPTRVDPGILMFLLSPFCSIAVLDPRVGHTVDVLSPFIPVLCHSD